MTAPIQSKRLDLIPMTPAFLRASLDHNTQKAEQVLQLSLPSDWPGESEAMLGLRRKQLEEDPTLQQWLIRAMVLRGAAFMVGHIGFHTAPDAEYLRTLSPGGVEFGFTVFPSFQRQGFAREAAIALIHWARQTHGVNRFVLSIRPDNVPSQRLAAELGFRRIGSHVDEIDGLEEILERRFCSDDAELGDSPSDAPAMPVGD
ncbi:MAG: N-acetyltransferase [Puniceicoccaceae bacterium]|nr:MAG: N-acetyltransferase [Puniceicoccaceae bacterium]